MSYKTELEDILFPQERIMYKKILKELENNKEFYLDSDPIEKTKSLAANCEIDEKDLYLLLKKVVVFGTG